MNCITHGMCRSTDITLLRRKCRLSVEVVFNLCGLSAQITMFDGQPVCCTTKVFHIKEA